MRVFFLFMLIYSISYPRLCGQKMQWVFFLYKPRQKMVIIFSSSYKYRLSGYTSSNDNKKHSFDTLFFTFPPSFTQFTSSWPHRQFFLFFLWSLCAVLSLLDPSSDGDLCVLGSSLVAPDPHGVCCPVCWT